MHPDVIYQAGGQGGKGLKVENLKWLRYSSSSFSLRLFTLGWDLVLALPLKDKRKRRL